MTRLNGLVRKRSNETHEFAELFTIFRFNEIVDMVDFSDGWWRWTGNIDTRGYPRVRAFSRMHKVHRLFYQVFYGPIPNGMIVRHLNDVKVDVSPWNLAIGTAKDNAQDCTRNGHNAMLNRTHCPVGHAYSPENTRISKGSRECKECDRQRHRDSYLPRQRARSDQEDEIRALQTRTAPRVVVTRTPTR